MTEDTKKPWQFQKGAGKDPRINRKGRPKSFDALRKLALQISHELVREESGEPMVIDAHYVTNAELILRRWANSREPQLQKGFVEIAFGKVPDELKVKADGTVVHKGNAFDYAGFAAAFAACLGIAGPGSVASDGAGESDDPPHTDPEAGSVPGAANS